MRHNESHCAAPGCGRDDAAQYGDGGDGAVAWA